MTVSAELSKILADLRENSRRLHEDEISGEVARAERNRIEGAATTPAVQEEIRVRARELFVQIQSYESQIHDLTKKLQPLQLELPPLRALCVCEHDDDSGCIHCGSLPFD